MLALLAAVSSGCVTANTLEAAKKSHVEYQPSTPARGDTPAEIDHVEKGNPELYALLPLAVAADVALLPVYVVVVVGVNVGLIRGTLP